MTLNTSQDLALNVLLSQQARDNAIVAAVPKLRLVKTPKASKEVPSTNGKNLVSVPGMKFNLTPGSYTAKDFMVAWRRAKDRNEQIQAMAGYVGYDPKAVFSVNEYTNMSQAKKALAPSHQVTEVKEQKETKGYVAGLPNNQFKQISDLVGREKMAAAALIEHELTASNMAEGSTEQLTALGMAEIERERLTAIRFDLSLLVK